MLIRGQHRHTDQCEPGMQQPAPHPAKMLRIAHPQHNQQHDVQRWRLIEGFVKTQQHREQPAEHAPGLGPHEAVAQRPQQKTRHADQLCAEQAQCMGVQLAAIAADKKRDRVARIDRPVRHDGPRPERHAVFPAEYHRRHLRRPPGQRVGQAVTEEEKRPQQRQPQRGTTDWPRSAAHASTRCAIDTVKMPNASMRCATLRKPAASTRPSISCWLRRRITQATPSR